MAQTYRDERVREFGLITRDHHDFGNERVKAGDIAAARLLSHGNSHGEVGTGINAATGLRANICERCDVLWLRVESIEYDLGNIDWTASIEEGDVRYEKRRYCIQLDDLKVWMPRLDLARVADKADQYQPFMGGIDQDRVDAYSFRRALAEHPVDEPELRALMNTAGLKRLGRVNPLDTRKMLDREVVLRPDGSWTLNAAGEQTGGHYLYPEDPLLVEGLVFDKQRQRYL